MASPWQSALRPEFFLMSEVGEPHKQASLCCLCCGVGMQAEDGCKLAVRRACTASSREPCLSPLSCLARDCHKLPRQSRSTVSHSKASCDLVRDCRHPRLQAWRATKRLCSAASITTWQSAGIRTPPANSS